MGLAEVWAEFNAAAGEYDKSLREGFWQFIEGDRVIDTIADPEQQDKYRKAQWREVLNKVQAMVNAACSQEYYEAYLPMGNTSIILTYAGWREGQDKTGIADNEWPALTLTRAKAGKLAPLTREEYNQWRAIFGCGPAKMLPPGTTPPPATTGTTGDLFPGDTGAGGMGGFPTTAAAPALIKPIAIGLGIAAGVLIVGWIAVKLSKRR